MSAVQGTFHAARRHSPLGRNVVLDQTICPWAQLPRPGIHVRLPGEGMGALDVVRSAAQEARCAGLQR